MSDFRQKLFLSLGFAAVICFIMSAKSHASEQNVELFGIDLASATRAEFRAALQQHGVRPEEINDESWVDKHDAEGVVDGIFTIEVSHNMQNQRVAEVKYQLPRGKSVILEVGERLVRTYGDADVARGRSNIGSATLGWRLPNGVNIILTRSWPGSRTNLYYRVMSEYRIMQREKEQAERVREAEQEEDTAHAF